MESLPLTGGTLTGPVLLQSSLAGGENTTDSTSRLTVESYQRAQQRNDSGQYAHYGEGIRLRLMQPRAKNMIAWEDAFTDPTQPRTIAWVGAHYLPNDADDPVHQHWSVEVTDSRGDLQTRFEVPYGRDWTNIRTSHADLTVGHGGVLRIAGRGMAKSVEWSNDILGGPTGRRWRLLQDDAAEAGDNVGSDLRLTRYADNGNLIGDAMIIQRASGTVTLRGLEVQSADRGIVLTAPNGSRWRLRVDDAGALSTTPA